MSLERDADRLTRAWLELGPDHAPERTIAAVLQSIETTPQVRRPWRWSSWRDFRMNRLTLIATVTATLVVGVGSVLLLNRPPDPSIGTPTASPSASGSAAGTIPDELRYLWIGEPRPIGSVPPTTRTALVFTETDFHVDGTDIRPAGVLQADAELVRPGQVRLTSTDERNALCDPGDGATYRYSLSPGGTRLTVLADGPDPCATRAETIPGEWLRVACKNADDGCWGELEAGTYPTQYIRPDLRIGEPWEPLLGAMSFTAPSGWALAEDWPEQLRFTPAEDYALESSDGPTPTSSNILVWTNPAPNIQDEACTTGVAPGIDQTPAAFVEWIAGLPGVDATTPASITIDGREARWVDVALKGDWTQSCPFITSGTPAVMIYTSAADNSNSYQFGLEGDQRQRLVVIDVGGGRIVMVQLMSGDPDDLEAFAARAMPIIESFDFR